MLDRDTRLIKSLVKCLSSLEVTFHDYTRALQRERPPDWWRRLKGPLQVIGVSAAVAVAVFTGFSLREIAKQAQSTQAQVGIMQKQLEAADRAWIRVSLLPSNPITYTNLGEAQLSVLVGMKNVGRAVASDCVIKFKFLVPKDNEVFTEPVKQQMKVCGRPPDSLVKDTDIGPIKTTVFPDDEGRLGIGDNIPVTDIRKASVPDSGPLKGKFIAPYVVGCVDYTFATSTKHHQTGFIYEIMRIEPPHAPLAIEIGKALPAERVHLEKYLFGGDYAY